MRFWPGPGSYLHYSPPLVALKTIRNLSMQSKVVTHLLNFLMHDFLWFISWLTNFQSWLFYLICILFGGQVYLINLIHLWNNSKLYHHFFEGIRMKHARKITPFFTCKHKIKDSNVKVPTHDGIVCLYSKNVWYDVFMSDKFFNFFRNMFKNKTININDLLFVTKQSNPVCVLIFVFVQINIFISLGKLSLEKHTIKYWIVWLILWFFNAC